MDLSLAVLEQRYRQPHRQLGGFIALHLLAERQLIEEDLVLRGQVLVFDPVFQAEVQLAFVDDIPQVRAGIGRCRGEIDIFEINLQVEEQVVAEGVYGTCYDKGGMVFQVAAQVHGRRAVFQ